MQIILNVWPILAPDYRTTPATGESSMAELSFLTNQRLLEVVWCCSRANPGILREMHKVKRQS